MKLELDDFEIELDKVCPVCGGSKKIVKMSEEEYMKWPRKITVTCDNCLGTGIVLTENGKTLLEFVKKYNHD